MSTFGCALMLLFQPWDIIFECPTFWTVLMLVHVLMKLQCTFQDQCQCMHVRRVMQLVSYSKRRPLVAAEVAVSSRHVSDHSCILWLAAPVLRFPTVPSHMLGQWLCCLHRHLEYKDSWQDCAGAACFVLVETAFHHLRWSRQLRTPTDCYLLDRAEPPYSYLWWILLRISRSQAHNFLINIRNLFVFVRLLCVLCSSVHAYVVLLYVNFYVSYGIICILISTDENLMLNVS